MGVWVFPLKSINGSNMYGPDDFRQFYANILSTGIIATAHFPGATALQVTQTETASLNVNLGAGVANLSGGQIMNNEPILFVVPAPLSSQTRTDSIVVQWNSSANTGDFIYKENSTQVVRTDDVFELQLCTIKVPANATSISQANITDTRADETVCGYSSPFEKIETGDLLAQFKSELEAHETLFDSWFQNLKDQLDDNQAANLQNQIDVLTSEKANDSEVVHLTGDQEIEGILTVDGLINKNDIDWTPLGAGSKYKKSGSRVTISFDYTPATSANFNMGTLPEGLRPTIALMFDVAAFSSVATRNNHVQINEAGTCTLLAPIAKQAYRFQVSFEI